MKLREFVVTLLNDIKLPRKDLLTSHFFSKEGINHVLDCIEDCSYLKEDEKGKLSELTQRNQIDELPLCNNLSV